VIGARNGHHIPLVFSLALGYRGRKSGEDPLPYFAYFSATKIKMPHDTQAIYLYTIITDMRKQHCIYEATSCQVDRSLSFPNLNPPTVNRIYVEIPRVKPQYYSIQPRKPTLPCQHGIGLLCLHTA
jgi:hypothetical protein